MNSACMVRRTHRAGQGSSMCSAALQMHLHGFCKCYCKFYHMCVHVALYSPYPLLLSAPSCRTLCMACILFGGESMGSS